MVLKLQCQSSIPEAVLVTGMNNSECSFNTIFLLIPGKNKHCFVFDFKFTVPSDNPHQKLRIHI